MTESHANSITIPDDLREMCKMYAFSDPDVADLFPPEVVVRVVTADSPELAELQFLEEWLSNREMLWDRAEAILEALEGNVEGDLPPWIVQPWALTLGSRWGSGLAKAISGAEKWLAETST